MNISDAYIQNCEFIKIRPHESLKTQISYPSLIKAPETDRAEGTLIVFDGSTVHHLREHIRCVVAAFVQHGAFHGEASRLHTIRLIAADVDTTIFEELSPLLSAHPDPKRRRYLLRALELELCHLRGPRVFEALRACTRVGVCHLQALSLVSCGLRDAHTPALRRLVLQTPSVQKLELHNARPLQGLPALARMRSEPTIIHFLGLLDTVVSDRRVVSVFTDALAHTSPRPAGEPRLNWISDAGAAQLAELLEFSGLAALNLLGNPISSAAAERLLRALEVRGSPARLALSPYVEGPGALWNVPFCDRVCRALQAAAPLHTFDCGFAAIGPPLTAQPLSLQDLHSSPLTPVPPDASSAPRPVQPRSASAEARMRRETELEAEISQLDSKLLSFERPFAAKSARRPSPARHPLGLFAIPSDLVQRIEADVRLELGAEGRSPFPFITEQEISERRLAVQRARELLHKHQSQPAAPTAHAQACAPYATYATPAREHSSPPPSPPRQPANSRPGMYSEPDTPPPRPPDCTEPAEKTSTRPEDPISSVEYESKTHDTDTLRSSVAPSPAPSLADAADAEREKSPSLVVDETSPKGSFAQLQTLWSQRTDAPPQNVSTTPGSWSNSQHPPSSPPPPPPPVSNPKEALAQVYRDTLRDGFAFRRVTALSETLFTVVLSEGGELLCADLLRAGDGDSPTDAPAEAHSFITRSRSASFSALVAPPSPDDVARCKALLRERSADIVSGALGAHATVPLDGRAARVLALRPTDIRSVRAGRSSITFIKRRMSNRKARDSCTVNLCAAHDGFGKQLDLVLCHSPFGPENADISAFVDGVRSLLGQPFITHLSSLVLGDREAQGAVAAATLARLVGTYSRAAMD
eukprot:gnl/Chilomastix_cuspidata/7186.p1 GENE.gnl/Chilomastix_cuspidata/7186~~gnl/Chilomastix_cuspidata/7186.p1  ORF type:complete len:870 (+),score=223.11 gnl/Chilomastix_cuspidata/7186:96-2705(+)